jgi:hypothetical protein
MAQQQFVDTAGASKWLDEVGFPIAEQTLKNMRARTPKTGPRYVKIGGKVRYRIADLERYLEQHAVDPRAAA